MLELIMIAIGLYVSYTVVKSDASKAIADKGSNTIVNVLGSVDNLATASSIYTEDLSKDFKYDSLVNDIKREDKLGLLAKGSVKATTDNTKGMSEEEKKAYNLKIKEFKEALYS